MAQLPTPSELLQFPKCYAKDCERSHADGTCPRETCPIPSPARVMTAAEVRVACELPPGTPPPVVENPRGGGYYHPDEGAVPPGIPVRAADVADRQRKRLGDSLAARDFPLSGGNDPLEALAEAGRASAPDELTPLLASRLRVRSSDLPPDPPFPVDPRDAHTRSVLQSWVTDLGRRHQGVLLTAVRGCDTESKNAGSKRLVRAYRAYVLVPFVKRLELAATFISPATGRELETRFQGFRRDCDHMPHHYVMHFVHAAEIIGYHHFGPTARAAWGTFYLDLCRGLHLNPETRDELDARLTADEDAFGREDRR